MKSYLDYFKELATIPHGSGNTKRISDYLTEFAKDRNLYCRQDELNNVIIIKEAATGYENHDSVILQGHMDMVAVKEASCNKDMANEGLDLFVEDNNLKAKGTSLGGDDGIAVAYIMDILDGNYNAPRIEAIITVDEEVGMLGASGIELPEITSKRMINIDQEEEGIFVVSCAGGAGLEFKLPFVKERAFGDIFTISVSGLKGGHSGVEINMNRGNAIKILVDELCKLSSQGDFSIIAIDGGDADNAIPNRVVCEVMLIDNCDALKNLLVGINNKKIEFIDAKNYDCAVISSVYEGSKDADVIDVTTTKRLLNFLREHRYGVVAMDDTTPDFVKTSLNPGKISTTGEHITLLSSVRSSVYEEKKELIDELCKLADEYNIPYTIDGVYDGWAYNPDSALRNQMVKIYEDMFGNAPKLEAIHAGLECGVFASKIEGLDCISVGPDILNIHSINEYLPLDSAERTYQYLLKVLEAL